MAESIVAYSGPIISRAEAKTQGDLKYLTGKPCGRGHYAQRLVSSRGCVICAEEVRWRRIGKNPNDAREAEAQRRIKSARALPPESPAGSRYIPLTRGYFALVDDLDFDRVSQFKWTPVISKEHDLVYAVRRGRKALGEPRTVSMHRFVLGMTPDDKRKVDHKESNGLDNRRHMIRPCTNAENLRNRGVTKRKASRFKGVFARDGKYRAAIRNGEGKLIQLGTFTVDEDAARAYDIKATELHGEFARLNFPK